jgi:hypothetical protein
MIQATKQAQAIRCTGPNKVAVSSELISKTDWFVLYASPYVTAAPRIIEIIHPIATVILISENMSINWKYQMKLNDCGDLYFRQFKLGLFSDVQEPTCPNSHQVRWCSNPRFVMRMITVYEINFQKWMN